MTPDELTRAHERSFRNKPVIAASTVCGCFYCLKTCAPQMVREFVRKDETALCPYCGVDALIGDASEYPVADPQFLQEMHAFWFLESVGQPRRQKVDSELRNLLLDLIHANFEDNEQFRSLLTRFMMFVCADTHVLAALLGTNPSGVERWRMGATAPHPTMRRHVYASLAAEVRKALDHPSADP